MNKKIISIIAAGGLSLMAGAAFAQSSSAQQSTPQNPPPTTSSGSMSSGSMNGSMNSGSSGMNNGSTGTTPPPFSTLDTQGNGYLTQQDASQNSWLGMHWAQCDSDHDGKVTRSEYDACSQQQ
jgi:hypothetical protein